MQDNLVFICSPLRGDYESNQAKARQHCRDAVLDGYIPIAPHIYFTQFLDDDIEQERVLGIDCGIDLLGMCSQIWVYAENGVTEGMQAEVNFAKENGIEIIWK